MLKLIRNKKADSELLGVITQIILAGIVGSLLFVGATTMTKGVFFEQLYLTRDISLTVNSLYASPANVDYWYTQLQSPTFGFIFTEQRVKPKEDPVASFSYRDDQFFYLPLNVNFDKTVSIHFQNYGYNFYLAPSTEFRDYQQKQKFPYAPAEDLSKKQKTISFEKENNIADTLAIIYKTEPIKLTSIEEPELLLIIDVIEQKDILKISIPLHNVTQNRKLASLIINQALDLEQIQTVVITPVKNPFLDKADFAIHIEAGSNVKLETITKAVQSALAQYNEK